MTCLFSVQSKKQVRGERETDEISQEDYAHSKIILCAQDNFLQQLFSPHMQIADEAQQKAGSGAWLVTGLDVSEGYQNNLNIMHSQQCSRVKF